MSCPDLRPEPEVGDGWVRFVQTMGGRTGAPMPRRVGRPPFVQVVAATVWTTLALTIHADGRVEHEVTGVSAFPRHRVYDDAGQGTPGDELCPVLDGMVTVEVDGAAIAEVEPGAMVGERAVLEGGTRTSTLRATTPCRVAVAHAARLDRAALHELSAGHRRGAAASGPAPG